MSKKSKQAWVTGTIYAAPKKICAYEHQLECLGLQAASLEELMASEALLAWVQKNKERFYVPALLLSCLEEKTEWDVGEKEDRSLPKFSLWDAREEQPVYEI